MLIPDPIVHMQAGAEFVDVIDEETGEPIADIVRASPAGGWFEVQKRDNEGEFVRDHGQIVTERFERVIRYELRPDAPPFYQQKWGVEPG